MNAGTGVVSIFLALGALVISAVSSKTADARPSYSNLHAFKATAITAPTATTATTPAVAPAATSTLVTAPEAAPSAPVAAAASVDAERITPPRLLQNRGLRRLKKAETSSAMLQAAARIVRRHYAKPVGTEITVEIEGKQVTARIERHFHPEGGPVKPWGFHPGVSLFVAR
ncbi:MAG TPA: hypothetical protein VHP33_40995 [Polyangiaceae bacterium]|nr:hypothetical protein [Polyangiaceae bacterium]